MLEAHFEELESLRPRTGRQTSQLLEVEHVLPCTPLRLPLTLAESIQARFKGQKRLPELLWRANHAASLSAEGARSATAAMLCRANDAASLSAEHGTATGAAAESAEPRGPRLSGGSCEGCATGDQGRFESDVRQ
eukprot:scaffold239_cov226-Pinguiococcus_pyrenoidosus.AAC.2